MAPGSCLTLRVAQQQCCHPGAPHTRLAGEFRQRPSWTGGARKGPGDLEGVALAM